LFKSAIINGRIFQNGDFQSKALLISDDGRISKILDKSDTDLPGYGVIDAEGNYVLPGFIDSHVHFDDLSGEKEKIQRTLRAFLRNGVTTIRCTGGTLEYLLLLKREIENGIMKGPRIYCSGPLLDGADPYWRTMSLIVEDAENARKVVKSLSVLGVDFVKAYMKISPDVLQVIIEESHANGLQVTIHPRETTAIQAIDLGVDGVEHVGSLIDESYVERENLVRSNGFVYDENFIKTWQLVDLSSAGIEALVKKIVESGVHICPTLVVYKSMWMVDERKHRNYEINSDAIPEWWVSWEKHWKDQSLELRQSAKIGFNNMQKLVGLLAKHGANIIAGSDTPNAFVPEGSSLLEEMELLVEAGMTPSGAISAATSKAAVALGQQKMLGSIGEGKIADLVFVKDNPLDDIRNIRNIAKVVKAGKPLSCNSVSR